MPPTAENPPISQPVHSDADFDHPRHPFALVVNVPLITMTPENGSTEVWLGTHRGTDLSLQEGQHGDRASGRIKTEKLEKRRAIRPPCQPVVPKGSIVIRDLRLWHAGVGNQTDVARVMLAMSKFNCNKWFIQFYSFLTG
jgi:ectoine hydroxylase-related dioxygenase (phytanoyl-CoA dioxygenase family)